MRLRVQRIKNISEEIMRVLIACEFSGIIRDAFLERGHNAISCDLLPTERPGPHYQGNVFDILYNGWDLLIAHPPCTHLAVSGDGNSMGMFDRSTDVAILKINKSNYKQINLNGMTNSLKRKIEVAIERIIKAEKVAEKYSANKQVILAFSGGKDSQVIYELAKMSGIKFFPIMRLTTLDYPEVVRFVRENYKDVIIERPSKNIYKLIIERQSLPTQIARFCCQALKEVSGKGNVVIVGIRKAESIKRAKRNELEVSGHKYSDTIDHFNLDVKNKVVCLNGEDKILVSPILDWTDRDVWEFIHSKNIKYCKLYDEGYSRIGCVFCPFSPVKVKQRDRKKYPKIEKLIKRSIAELVKKGKYAEFNGDVDEIFEWWISNKTVEQYKASKLNYKIEF